MKEEIEVIKNKDPSYIHIPVYTEELLKEANKKAKIILELDIRTITYSVLMDVFGKKIADKVYVSETVKINYKRYAVPVIKDVILFLKVNQDINLRGYIFVDEIVEELEMLNSQRKIVGKSYTKIFKGIKKFVIRVLRYNPEVKKVMNEKRH